MSDEPANFVNPTALPFECEGCGQGFESWDRLRQHQIDCGQDENDNAI